MTAQEAKEAMANLEFTRDMILFDPNTGRRKEPRMLNGSDRVSYKGCEAGILALKKQIPEKPLFEGNITIDTGWALDTWICPRCNASYNMEVDEYDYCPQCGQCLDWETEND